MRDENGGGWEVKQVLYADDTIMVAERREHLQLIVSEFKRACDSMRLNTKLGKGEVLMVKKDQMGVVRR